MRIARQNVEDLLALFHPPRVNFVSEHGLDAGVMETILEEKFRITPRLPDAPTGKRLRDVDDVVLRVAAIHPECVQFHELAAIILIQAALLLLFCIRVWIIRISIRRRSSLGKPRSANWPSPERSPTHLPSLLLLLMQLLPSDRIRGQPVVQEK